MAFYHPSISKLKDRFLIADNLEEVIFCKYNSISLPVGTYNPMELEEDSDAKWEADRIFDEFGVYEFEIVEKFHGVMEPYGAYVDRSDLYLGDSIAEVAQQLLDYFYDQDSEYMDEDEKEEREWLEEIVKGESE